MSFRALFSNVLADLKLAQLSNDGRANHHGHEHGGEAGERSPECQIPKNAKGREVVVPDLIQQPIEQLTDLPSELSLGRKMT